MTTFQKTYAALSIREYEIPLFLGWSENERSLVQVISVDLNVRFHEPPPACETDQLEDTLCYSWLTDKIKNATMHQTFYLIESVAKRIYTLTKSLIPFEAAVQVTIHKKPSIAGLNGGVTFSYGDPLA